MDYSGEQGQESLLQPIIIIILVAIVIILVILKRQDLEYLWKVINKGF